MTTSESAPRAGKPTKDKTSEKRPGVKLLLVCHGEGMQHRYAGLANMNSGLTAKGWEEVESLAIWLSTHESLRGLYTGPMLQSRLTAQRIGQASRLAVSVLQEPEELVSGVIQSRKGNPQSGDAPANANSADDGKGASEEKPALPIMAGQEDGTYALVASPDTIRVMLRKLLDANETLLEIDHTSVTGLRLKSEAWSIAYVNRREHLPASVLPVVEDKAQPPQTEEPKEDLASIVAVYDRVGREDVAAKASDDRERIRSLLDFAELSDGMEILDVGTGLGVLAVMLAEEGADSVIGVDVSPGMLEQAEYLRLSQPTDSTHRVSYRLGRVQALPFEDERFDAVTCRLVLNHFQAPERAVREFVRVLRPDGVFLMAELLSADDPVKRATQNAIEERRNPSHVAARSAEQYNKMITDAGLSIEKTASVSIVREMHEWLRAYRTPEQVAATVIDMVEAGLETDAAGIGARKRGDRIEFVQRMYYLRARKPGESE